MKACDYGPVMVVQPQGLWYGKVASEDTVDEILDALEDGEVVDSLLIT
jgi:(2Fe-2S) ferredoxin